MKRRQFLWSTAGIGIVPATGCLGDPIQEDMAQVLEEETDTTVHSTGHSDGVITMDVTTNDPVLEFVKAINGIYAGAVDTSGVDDPLEVETLFESNIDGPDEFLFRIEVEWAEEFNDGTIDGDEYSSRTLDNSEYL